MFHKMNDLNEQHNNRKEEKKKQNWNTETLKRMMIGIFFSSAISSLKMIQTSTKLSIW